MPWHPYQISTINLKKIIQKIYASKNVAKHTNYIDTNANIAKKNQQLDRQKEKPVVNFVDCRFTEPDGENRVQNEVQ